MSAGYIEPLMVRSSISESGVQDPKAVHSFMERNYVLQREEESVRQNKREEYRHFSSKSICCQAERDSDQPLREPTINEGDLSGKIRCIDGGKTYYIPRQLFARIIMEQECLDRRCVRFDTGAELYDMSLSQFKNIAAAANARYKLNRMVLVDLDRVDKYLAQFAMSE